MIYTDEGFRWATDEERAQLDRDPEFQRLRAAMLEEVVRRNEE